MSETKQEPIVATRDLLVRILFRSLAMLDYLTADEARLKDYMEAEYKLYVEGAKHFKEDARPVEEFARVFAADMNYVRTTIAGILTRGTVAPKAPEVGQYL